MPDPLQVKPHEVGIWTTAIGSLGYLLRSMIGRRRGEPAGAGGGARVRELEAQLAESAERLAEEKLKGLESRVMFAVTTERLRIDDILRENGKQAQRLEQNEDDNDALGQKVRDLALRVQALEET
jgi:hypothetical protein